MHKRILVAALAAAVSSCTAARPATFAQDRAQSAPSAQKDALSAEAAPPPAPPPPPPSPSPAPDPVAIATTPTASAEEPRTRVGNSAMEKPTDGPVANGASPAHAHISAALDGRGDAYENLRADKTSAKRALDGKLARRYADDAGEDRDSKNDDRTEARDLAINGLVDARQDHLSTFAVDVDTGSFSLSRRLLESGGVPNAGNVRVEEWVNAFHYSYEGPRADSKVPFAIHVEGAPLAKQSYVVRVGVQGKRIAKADRAPTHLTFLVDVSGSMRPTDRLPLAKQSLALLVDALDERDSISLVTYAGRTALVLPSTTVTNANRAKIKEAIAGLAAGGGTHMESGMELAYREANKALGQKGISRVIVLTDGDTNIGHTTFPEIKKTVHGYVSEGVTLSTVGFGTGNYRDHLLEQLADSGNGNYSYVGSLKDAQKIFVDDLTGTLQVIAKDAKVQVDMNPDIVASYRLIGYENRDVADQDFRNDKVDAGEIGAGHTVTALYEVVLRADDVADVDTLATVRVRWKQPHGDEASETATTMTGKALAHTVEEMSADGRFAVGVGLAAEVFRHSSHMDRLGIGLADALRLIDAGSSGPHAAERKDFARLLRPLAAGADVAAR